MLWKLLAWLVSRPWIADALIAYAKREPYWHIDDYMNRWWVFNPYGDEQPHGTRYSWCEKSARLHHILRRDLDPHKHDHPWNARTLIVRGWYVEERDDGLHLRVAGDTATLRHNEFHRITEVSPGGVFTLFITGPYLHRWGFRLDDGTKIGYRQYLGLDE